MLSIHALNTNTNFRNKEISKPVRKEYKKYADRNHMMQKELMLFALKTELVEPEDIAKRSRIPLEVIKKVLSDEKMLEDIATIITEQEKIKSLYSDEQNNITKKSILIRNAVCRAIVETLVEE